MDNARDADFRMLFKDMGYDERRAKKKNSKKQLVQGQLAVIHNQKKENYDDVQKFDEKEAADVPILE